MPIVADEIRVPGLNAISDMKRGPAGRTGMGNFKIALGIETEEIKIKPQKPQIKTKNPQQNKTQNKPKNMFFSRPEVSTHMTGNLSYNLLN